MSKSVFIATPTGNGKFDRSYILSLINSMVTLSRNKITSTWETSESCYVMANRDALATKFIDQTDFTHLLFIDSDMAWEPNDILRMLGHELPIVCGPYVTRNNNTWTLLPIPGEKPQDGLLKVQFSGTGMMMIERRVLETLAKGAERYKAYGDMFYRLFQIRYEDGRMHGEDVSFCQDARRAGFDVVVDLKVLPSHLAERHLRESTTALEKELADGSDS